MQYDSRRITEAQADDLMATYLRKIRAFARHGESSSRMARQPDIP